MRPPRLPARLSALKVIRTIYRTPTFIIQKTEASHEYAVGVNVNARMHEEKHCGRSDVEVVALVPTVAGERGLMLDHEDEVRYCQRCKTVVPLTEWRLDGVDMVFIHVGNARWCLDEPDSECGHRDRIPRKVS